MSVKKPSDGPSSETFGSSPQNSLVIANRQVIPQIPQAPETTPTFVNQVLTPPEITEAHVREIADFFRLIFNNDWPQYVVCPPCDSMLPSGMQLSAPDVYGTNDEMVSLEMMEENPNIPNCPNCSQTMKILHDPEKTTQNMRDRLKEGYVSLLRDEKTNAIEGLVYGYACSLAQQFYSEFGNKYVYMAERPPQYERSFEKFLQHLRQAFPDQNFEPGKKVFCWNCAATSRRARGGKYLRGMINTFIDSIPPEFHDLFTIGETLAGSRFHQLLSKAGTKDIPGFLENPEVLTGEKFSVYARGFRLPPHEFSKTKT